MNTPFQFFCLNKICVLPHKKCAIVTEICSLKKPVMSREGK